MDVFVGIAFFIFSVINLRDSLGLFFSTITCKPACTWLFVLLRMNLSLKVYSVAILSAVHFLAFFTFLKASLSLLGVTG
jgi:hypothetical protein